MKKAYCSIGHLSKKEDIDNLERILLYNYKVISKFDYIVIHQNCSDSMKPYLSDYYNIWKKVFDKDVTAVPPLKNRGHTFGYMDSDNAVVNACKSLPVEFIYKSVNDLLLDEKILDINITDEFDFYFLQGIGYTGLSPFNYDIDEYIRAYSTSQYLFPQTNFYIIKNMIDYIYNKKDIDAAFNHCQSISTFNGRVWEYIQDFSCEKFLADCVIRNNLKYKHLISDESFKRLLLLIKEYKICDCSHKNIYIDEIGVCHYHDPNSDCLIV